MARREDCAQHAPPHWHEHRAHPGTGNLHGQVVPHTQWRNGFGFRAEYGRLCRNEADRPRRQKLRLLCGETLDENDNFTQENFQDRNRHKEGGTAQLLELVCKEGENHYKPSFTIMGFRYAKVETDIDLTGAEFTAHAVYSEMPVTGSFGCGNADVNRLVQNSVWSQKGNFCDIPTDCPTRERAGWTGDMGVFIETGLT